MQCCSNMVDTTLYRLFSHKSCLLAMGEHPTSNFLIQCWPNRSWKKCRLFLCAKLFLDWVNIARVVFLCNVGSGRSRQHGIWLFSLRKDDYVFCVNIAPVIVLFNFVSAVFGQHWLDCGLWATFGHANIVCIVQVIVLCNVDPSRPRQHYVSCFSANTCLYAPGQYCASSFLVPCCFRRIWTTLAMRYISMQCCPAW